MKVQTLTNVANGCTIETNLAKIGLVYKYGLGAVYTDALAKSKFDALTNQCDITLVSGEGNKAIAYKVALNKLAEISSLGPSNVVIRASATANFAEAFFVVDISTAGDLLITPNQIRFEVSALAASETLDVYAMQVPTESGYLIAYEQVNVIANSPKNIDVSDAITVSFTKNISKIDMFFANGQTVTYELNELILIHNELNEQSVNVNGIGYIIPLTFSIPVSNVRAITVYSDNSENIIVSRLSQY